MHTFHSEPTREAALQAGVGKRADRLTVAYHSPDVEIGLASRGVNLLAGPITSEVFIDGAAADSRGDWRSVCWHVDDDGYYLELQLCGRSLHVDRQIFLSRPGRFAILADSVMAPSAGRIDYRMNLPIADGVSVELDGATRACRLRAAGSAARVFPLGLPQDRVHSAAGHCSVKSERLELTQAGAGCRLYVPLAFDWHPQRRHAAAEWRSLTVTELGEIVNADRAVGFRLRLGNHQLLIYRSLHLTHEPRAVLGHHTRHESVIGEFNAAGEVVPLVMVEVE